MELKIGLQLYSIRNAMQANPIKAIRDAARVGYRYLEIANLHADEDFGCGFNVPAKQLKAAATDAGCSIVSAHVNPLTDENLGRILAYYAELGAKYIISKPFSEKREEMDRSCEMYDWIGECCREFGMQHCLHTGLAPFLDDGNWLLDVVFAKTEPRNLMFELDSYWILRSGYDPLEIMKRFANRVMAIHQKDLPAHIATELNVNKVLGWGKNLVHDNFFDFVSADDFCEVGTGCMDVQGLIDAAREHTAAKYVIVEQDYTKFPEMESIRVSYDNLLKYRGVTRE